MGVCVLHAKCKTKKTRHPEHERPRPKSKSTVRDVVDDLITQFLTSRLFGVYVIFVYIRVMKMFDTELFISEVEKRPALYDARDKEYSDRELKYKLWDEIAAVMYKNWGTLPGQECRKKGNTSSSICYNTHCFCFVETSEIKMFDVQAVS